MAVKLFGVDVSEMNGKIDWAKVSKKVDYAIIRCGYGMNITSQDDANFEDNVNGCEKYNIPYGIYLYAYAKTVDAVQSEVDHTLRLRKKCGTNCKYGIWYDMEDSSTSGADLNAIGKAFCDKISAAGYRCGIYASTSWFANKLTKLDDYDKWVAQYYSVCEYKGSITMWQYTSTGKVSGISGNVDCNYCYTNKFVTAGSSSSNSSSSTDATTTKIKSYKVQVTATNGLNYRSGPGSGHSIKGAYTNGTIITITDKADNWGKTNKGWVCLDYTEAVTNYKVKVTAKSGLNYRSGAGTSYAVKGAYPYNTTLLITKQNAGWGKTDKGWVSLDYVKKV